MIKERLYTKSETVVMTSATMAVRKSFNFMKSGLGLMDEPRVDELILPSSFNYKEQLLLAIPDDLPEPASSSYADVISPLIADAFKTLKRKRAHTVHVIFTTRYRIQKYSPGP